MKCTKLESKNINVQTVSGKKVKKKHSVIYWIFIGWWLKPFIWLFITFPMSFVKLFKPKKSKIKKIFKSM